MDFSDSKSEGSAASEDLDGYDWCAAHIETCLGLLLKEEISPKDVYAIGGAYYAQYPESTLSHKHHAIADTLMHFAQEYPDATPSQCWKTLADCYKKASIGTLTRYIEQYFTVAFPCIFAARSGAGAGVVAVGGYGGYRGTHAIQVENAKSMQAKVRQLTMEELHEAREHLYEKMQDQSLPVYDQMRAAAQYYQPKPTGAYSPIVDDPSIGDASL